MFKLRTAFILLVALLSCGQMTALAQSANGDLPPDPYGGMEQVDITGGMADRSAMYAARVSGVPQTQPAPVLQGGCQQSQYAPMPSYQQMPQQMQQPVMGGQQIAQQMPYQQDCYQQVPQQAMQCGAQWAQPMPMQQQQQPQSSILSGVAPQLTSQAVGLLGAAAVFTYMTQGGMDGLFDTMRSRGFGGGFRTRGPSIGN